MISTHLGLKKISSMEYYRMYQEVQAAKQIARANLATTLATHEREKHNVSSNENISNDVMAPKKWGANLDVTA